LCPGSQESNSLSNQCTSQYHPQINVSNTADSLPADSPRQKNTKSPLILSKNTTESTSNQNNALNSNTSSLPSLFFHYWVPPGESINSVSTANNEGSESTSSPQSNILNSHEKETCAFSPSKKKRVSQPQSQQLSLPSFGNPILPPLSRRSPRHHLRHRSETSVLQSKFFDIPPNKQKNPSITNETNFQDTKTLVDNPLEFNKEKKYKDDRIFENTSLSELDKLWSSVLDLPNERLLRLGPVLMSMGKGVGEDGVLSGKSPSKLCRLLQRKKNRNLLITSKGRALFVTEKSNGEKKVKSEIPLGKSNIKIRLEGNSGRLWVIETPTKTYNFDDHHKRAVEWVELIEKVNKERCNH
ncbi:hypothetical protein PCK2_000268, partial [Pneumocystis canis]